MLQIGSINRLTVARFSDHGAYLTTPDGDEDVLLPRKYVPENIDVGTGIDVFVYTDSEDRPVATTLRPHAVVGEFAGLKVTDATPFGAFLDWGLEKDLLAPFSTQLERMVQGRTYLVRVCLDEVSGRVIAVSKLRRFLEEDTSDLQEGQKVELLIWEHSDVGVSAIINDTYEGLIFSSDAFGELNVGDRRPGYVKHVRADGKVTLSLSPLGYDALVDVNPEIIQALKAAGGFLPYNSKTPPDVIHEQFGMSKKAFKKLIGGLYRERKIVISDDGIRLA